MENSASEAERLTSVVSDPEDIRRIARKVGIDVGQLNLSGSAINAWDKVLEEAGKHNKVGLILDEVQRRYPKWRRHRQGPNVQEVVVPTAQAVHEAAPTPMKVAAVPRSQPRLATPGSARSSTIVGALVVCVVALGLFIAVERRYRQEPRDPTLEDAAGPTCLDPASKGWKAVADYLARQVVADSALRPLLRSATAEHYRLACKNGDMEGCFKLACCYKLGFGVGRDIDRHGNLTFIANTRSQGRWGGGKDTCESFLGPPQP